MIPTPPAPSPVILGPSRAPGRGSRGRLGRLLATLLLVVHVGSAGVLPVLDGSLESGGQVVAHWEDVSYSACPTLHDNAACRICQLLSSGQEAASGGLGEIVAKGATRPRMLVDASLALASPALGSNGPRAPPIV